MTARRTDKQTCNSPIADRYQRGLERDFSTPWPWVVAALMLPVICFLTGEILWGWMLTGLLILAAIFAFLVGRPSARNPRRTKVAQKAR